MPGEAAVVCLTCSTSISSQFIGFAAAHTFFALDQSKSTMPQPRVLSLGRTVSSAQGQRRGSGSGGAQSRRGAEQQRRTKSTHGSVSPLSLQGMMMVLRFIW